jgi:predicted metal-dependent hydrolase
MIQLAAAFHHYTRGNLKGTKSLLEAGLDKLRKFPSEYRGANLNALRRAADGWLEALTSGGPETLAEFPQVEFVQPRQ